MGTEYSKFTLLAQTSVPASEGDLAQTTALTPPKAALGKEKLQVPAV